MTNYVAQEELHTIFRIVRELNEIGVSSVSLDGTKVYDCNGEIVGRIEFSGDASAYVYVPNQED